MQRMNAKYVVPAALVASLIIGTAIAQAGSLKIDAQHSSVTFQVTHLMFTKVDGQFREFEGSFDLDEDTNTISNVAVTIQAASVDTNVEARDFFHQAMMVDPRFARAVSNVGLTHALDIFLGGDVDREESLRLAERYAEAAVKLDDTVPAVAR